MEFNFADERPTEDRREFLRVPTNCEVVARKIHYATDGIVQMWGEVKNVSAGGILFICEQGCCKSDEVKIEITLPESMKEEAAMGRYFKNDQPLTVAAICNVLRTRELEDGRCEVAAEFISIFNEDQPTLEAFVASEAGKLGIPQQVTV
jgi:hypothetical protein